MREWYRVDKIGNLLYEETVLVRADEPVLFVCMDEKKTGILLRRSMALMVNLLLPVLKTMY